MAQTSVGLVGTLKAIARHFNTHVWTPSWSYSQTIVRRHARGPEALGKRLGERGPCEGASERFFKGIQTFTTARTDTGSVERWAIWWLRDRYDADRTPVRVRGDATIGSFETKGD